MPIPLYIGDIRANIHQMRYTIMAFLFGKLFKELTNLEKKHHKHRLGELRFRSREKAYTQCPDSCNRHQEVLIESLTMHNAFDGLMQCVMSNEQIGNKINQQHLPHRQVVAVFNENCYS